MSKPPPKTSTVNRVRTPFDDHVDRVMAELRTFSFPASALAYLAGQTDLTIREVMRRFRGLSG